MENTTRLFYGIDMNTAVWCRTMEEAFYFFQIVSYCNLKWQNNEPFRVDDYKRWNPMISCFALRGSMGRTRDYDKLMTYTDFYKKMKPLLDAKEFKLCPFTNQETVNEEKVEKPETTETNYDHYASSLAKIIINEVSKAILTEYGFPSEIASETNEEKIIEWFAAEYQNPVEVSDKEKGFIHYCGMTGFIARDENNMLCWFNIRPQLEDGYWDVRKPCDGYKFKEIERDLFSFIRPGDMMSVHDILYGRMKGEQI